MSSAAAVIVFSLAAAFTFAGFANHRALLLISTASVLANARAFSAVPTSAAAAAAGAAANAAVEARPRLSFPTSSSLVRPSESVASAECETEATTSIGEGKRNLRDVSISDNYSINAVPLPLL